MRALSELLRINTVIALRTRSHVVARLESLLKLDKN